MARKLQEPTRLFTRVKPLSDGQQLFWDSLYDPEIKYTAVSGEAGTGKTFVSCYYALDLLLKERYNKIYVARSVRPIKSEEMGFLPGGADEKLKGYIVPMQENFEKFMPDTMFLAKNIELLPLVMVRGRSIENSIVICDESQNLSLEVLRALITRLNYRSKLILCGDFKQNDTNKKVTDFERFCNALDGMESFEWVQLSSEDQQRNRDITEINRRLDTI